MIFQCLVVYWVVEIWDILSNVGDKVLNMFIVIVYQSFPDCRFTLQFSCVVKNMIQIFPGMFAFERNIVVKINNLIKVIKFGSAELITYSASVGVLRDNIKPPC